MIGDCCRDFREAVDQALGNLGNVNGVLEEQKQETGKNGRKYTGE
jgi:hypothetical protein